jgi:hypothetical protein
LQARVMEDVWLPKWAAAHFGQPYAPARADFVKLAEILGRLRHGGTEEDAVRRFGKIADTALRQPEEFGWQGHRLAVVAQHLAYLVSETARREIRGPSPPGEAAAPAAKGRQSWQDEHMAKLERAVEEAAAEQEAKREAG